MLIPLLVVASSNTFASKTGTFVVSGFLMYFFPAILVIHCFQNQSMRPMVKTLLLAVSILFWPLGPCLYGISGSSVMKRISIIVLMVYVLAAASWLDSRRRGGGPDLNNPSLRDPVTAAKLTSIAAHALTHPARIAGFLRSTVKPVSPDVRHFLAPAGPGDEKT